MANPDPNTQIMFLIRTNSPPKKTFEPEGNKRKNHRIVMVIRKDERLEVACVRHGVKQRV